MVFLIFVWQVGNQYRMYICKSTSIEQALTIIDEPCIDYKYTTLTQEEFDALLLVERGVITKFL